MNPLDVATPEDVRSALVGGEFKRLVKYDATLGEQEKKHVMASAEHILRLAEQSMQTALYDLPPMPAEMYVMTIVSSLFATVYSYIFADEQHAKQSAMWYATFAGWMKDKEKTLVQEGADTYLLRIVDGRSGDLVLVTNARVNFTSLAQNVGAS